MKFIIVAIVVILIIYVIVVRRDLIEQKSRIDEVFEVIDECLKKRLELIPSFASIIKNYTSNENVSYVIGKEYDELNINEKIEINLGIEKELYSIMAILEDYPDLNADVKFIKINEGLNKIENDLATARKYYNALVNTYNQQLEIYPTKIVARIFNLKPQLTFEPPIIEKETIIA